jgi:hypothetical protein
MFSLMFARLWSDHNGEDIAEYAVMLVIPSVLWAQTPTTCSRRAPVQSNRKLTVARSDSELCTR